RFDPDDALARHARQPRANCADRRAGGDADADPPTPYGAATVIGKRHMTKGLLLIAALEQLCMPTFVRAAQGLPGDADCDGVLNRSADLAAVAAAFFEGSTCSAADVNADGLRTAADLAAEVRRLVAAPPTATPNVTASPTATATVAVASASPTDTASPTAS